jgi:hypothetical protein
MKSSWSVLGAWWIVGDAKVNLRHGYSSCLVKFGNDDTTRDSRLGNSRLRYRVN